MGARIHGAREERTGLVALQAGYAGDIVPGLARKPGISDLGAKGLSVVLELVDLGVESGLDTRDRAAGTDGKTVGISGQEGKSVVLQFLTDGLPLRLRGRVHLELGVGHPFVEGRRSRVVESVNGFVECGLVIELEMNGDIDLGRWIRHTEVFGSLNARRHIGCCCLRVR